jgi:hypothetical protein
MSDRARIHCAETGRAEHLRVLDAERKNPATTPGFDSTDE